MGDGSGAVVSVHHCGGERARQQGLGLETGPAVVAEGTVGEMGPSGDVVGSCFI